MSDASSPFARLTDIVEQGLCLGCGLCVGLAADRVELVMTEAGFLRPRARTPLAVDQMALIDAVCPGVRVTGLPVEATRGADVDPIWGTHRMIARAYAGDPEVRHQGSSGGVLTALGIHLLETGQVERIVHVAAMSDRPLRTGHHVSFTGDDVRRARGSRYNPSPTLIDFPAILDLGRPFALIGKPCDIAGARNLARHDPQVDALCKVMLAFVCGGLSSQTKTDDLLPGWGVAEDDVVACRHRGDGCPGDHEVETRDGRAFGLHLGEVWKDTSDWRLQHRCKICPDANGEGADIVVSDAWPGGVPVGDYESISGLIVRTPVGQQVVDGARGAGAIVVDRAWTPRDMDGMHPYQVRMKRSVGPRLAALVEAGQRIPMTTNLRVDALAYTDAAKRASEYGGMLGRAQAGRTVEPPAEPRRIEDVYR